MAAVGLLRSGFEAHDADLVALTILAIAVLCALLWRGRQSRLIATQLTTITKLASDAIVVINDRGEIVSWSGAAERLFGEPAATAIGSTIWKRMPAGLEAVYSRVFEQIVRGTVDLPEAAVEVPVVRADGTEFLSELSASTFTQGRRTFVLVTFHDISERARNERELRAANELAEGVLNAATEYSIIATDSAGRITVFNRGAERMLGYLASEVLGTETALLPHDRVEIAARALELGVRPGPDVVFHHARQGSGETREWTYVRKDNTRLPVLVTVNAMMSSDGAPRGFISIAHDLSAQRTAERRLAFANAAFEKAFDSAPVAIVLTRNDMTCLHANPAFRSLTGYELEDLRKMSMLDLVISSSEEELEELVVGFEPLVESQRNVQAGEARLRRIDGTEITIAFHVSVILDEDGTPLFFVAHAEDITARKAAEAAAQEAFDRNSEALAHLEELNRAKSQFVSMVSHELRTPTTSILGYVELLADGELGPLTDQQRGAVDAVERNSRRLEQLLADLMEASRLDLPELNEHTDTVDVSEVVQHAATTMLPIVARRKQSIEIVVDPHAGIVLGDERHLEHVVCNLLTNATKFTPDGGAIIVGTRREDDDVVIWVQDTGIGIAPEEQARVFERFYRSDSKEALKVPGTGLGLSIVKGITKHHGGDVALESEVGVGTTISIRLPRIHAQHAASERPKVSQR